MSSRYETDKSERWQIFVSYRRSDAAGWTAKLTEAMKLHFGNDAVFKDNESISAGEDFESRITQHLDKSKAVVVVIGKGWHGHRGVWHKSRISQRGDWIRRELETARDSVPYIFPVLVDNAALPERTSLPDALAFLPALQATELRPDRWEDDVAAFIEAMQRTMAMPLGHTGEVFQKRREIVYRYRRRRTVLHFTALGGLIVAITTVALKLIPNPLPAGVCLLNTSPASEATLDIGFWNIRRFTTSGVAGIEPHELEARQEPIANMLADMNLDAVGLLEVDEEAVKGLVSTLASKRLPYGYLYQEGSIGLNQALLYRRDRIQCTKEDDIYEKHALRLSEVDPVSGTPALPRIPLFAECRSRRLDTALLVVLVHYKSKAGFEESLSRQQHSSVLLGEIVGSHPNTVVGGTFHAFPEEAAVAFSGLAEVGGLRPLFNPDSSLITFIGSPQFASMLDYVWASRSVPLRSLEGCGAAILALDETEPEYIDKISDHRPIMVSVEYSR